MNNITTLKLKPSSANKWMVCSASALEESYIPFEDSKYNEQGRLLHSKVEELINKKNANNIFSDLSDEQKEFVQKAYEQVHHIINNDDIEYRTEVKVATLDKITTGIIDLIAYDRNTKTLYIVDHKFGQGVREYAKNNWQLVIYALAGWAMYKNATKFVLCINQPTFDCFSYIELTERELVELEKQLIEGVNEATSNTPSYNPSNSTCKFCKAKSSCPTLLEISKKFITKSKTELTEEDIVYILNNSENVKTIINSIHNFIDKVESIAIEKIKENGDFCGYTTVSSKYVRKYTSDSEEKLVEFLGNDAYKKTLITITEAEKKLGKQTMQEVPTVLVEQGVKLVKNSDLSLINDFNNII
jgi:CRISPR/Cas system-associated exonuclease Cas4 (RecB family)